MKKLDIFEGWAHRYNDPLETITAKLGNETVRATWWWDGGLDYSACCSFFEIHMDIISNLETPIMSKSEVEKLSRIFLAGCSYGNSLRKGDIKTDEILTIQRGIHKG